MDAATLSAWVEAYIHAWRTNDPDHIGRLFTEDAAYFTTPFAEPWRGRTAIVAGWLDRRDEPDTWTFRHEIMAVADDVGFVRGWTTYTTANPLTTYSNLWVVRLGADGRCVEFTEWWMEHA